MNTKRFLVLVAIVWLVALDGAGLTGAAVARAAGEPAEEFLDQLRAAKYFDMAIQYIDRLEKNPNIDRKLVDALDLERAQTHIDAAFASRSTKARDQFFADAEASLTAFLKKGPHPRQSEARLRLGKIQMVRAAELISGDPDPRKKAQARRSFEDAAKTFGQIVENLREKLKAMRGAKIDPRTEPDKAALREQFKFEFLEAMMNSGDALVLAAKTFDDPRRQGKTQLEAARKRFADLSDKYAEYVQGAIGLVRRGQAEELLGDGAAAQESYTKMLETVDADELRDAKYSATAGLLRLLLSRSPPAYDEAIDRGKVMLRGVRPNEEQLASVAQLKADLGRVHLAKSKDKNAKGKRESVNEARKLLLAASKIGGEHLAETKSLLTEMGVQPDDAAAASPDDAPPTSFDDALTKAQNFYSASLVLAKSVEALGRRNAPENEIETQQKKLYQLRFSGIQAIRYGLGMIDSQTDTNLVNTARQILCILLQQSGRHHEASVVGNFLARTAPGTEPGLSGGLVSLSSLQVLVRDNPDDKILNRQIADLGQYVSSTWPNDPKAAGAKQVRVQAALQAKNWDEALKQIELISDASTQAKSRRILGQYLYVEAVTEAKDGDAERAQTLRQRAAEQLKRGLDAIATGTADDKSMKAGLTLCKIQLALDDLGSASQTLVHPVYGPLTLLPKFGQDDAKFSSDLQSTRLQVIVQQMTSPSAQMDDLLAQAGEAMDQLRLSIPGSPAEKQKRLTRTYLGLAKKILTQIDQSQPGMKLKLATAFRLFLERVAKTTDDEATIRWIGQTLMQLAQSTMPPEQTLAQGVSLELLQTATETFDRLPEKAKSSPSTLYQSGVALRLQGDYAAAIKIWERLLKDRNTMINAQVEAALTYQQWAAKLPAKFAPKSYEKALRGAKPNEKKENTIWGWNKISRITSRSPQHRDYFFDARYHLAQCLYLQGKSRDDPKTMKSAINNVRLVVTLHPELGNETTKKKFDTLLKTVQKELGEPQIGLRAIQNN